MSPGYSPGAPWVSKIRHDGKYASEEVSFVDDDRTLAADTPLARGATRAIAAGMQHLGIQEAARKRREVGQRNGAWAGNVVYSDLGLD